jgi:hypothetical protein
MYNHLEKNSLLLILHLSIMSDPITLYVHDSYDLISKKILIAKMTHELLDNHVKYHTIAARLQTECGELMKKRLEIVKEMEAVLHPQLINFTAERQAHYNSLNDKYNALNENHLIPVTKQLDELKEIIEKSMKQVAYLQSTIVQEKMIEQYKIRLAPPAQNSSEQVDEVAQRINTYTDPDAE